jgi:hypothetical protein
MSAPAALGGWRAPAALLLLTGFLLAPLAYPGYFQPHSGFLPVYTLYAWEAAGHPLGSLAPYSPNGSVGGDGVLPYALAAGMRLAGADGPGAIKAVYALGLLLSATGAYALVRRLRPEAGPLPALALALVWAYSPMSVAAVYVRGSLGGSLALGVLPWLALAMAGRTRPVLAVSAGLAASLSHPGFALAGALAVTTIMLLSRERLSLWPLIAVLLAGLWGLAQGPAGPATPYLQSSLPYQWLRQQNGYAVHSDPWGPGLPAPLTLGFLPVALLAASWWQGRRAAHGPSLAVAVGTAAALLLLSTPVARPLWDAALGRALDGPWQLVALAAFLLVWAAAPRLAGLLHGRGAPAAALAMVALILAVPALDVPFTALEPAARPLASFDSGRILLVGAELHGPLRHGATPRVRLLWQATEPLARDYTVFVHVVDGADHKWGQRDSWPVDATRPTTSWRPGEIVVDEHPVYVDVAGPRDGLHLVVGLYDLETGERLPLADGNSALELGRED